MLINLQGFIHLFFNMEKTITHIHRNLIVKKKI